MIPTKRLEIVTDTHSMREVCRALETLGASGYTVLPATGGRGDRGRRDGDELSGVFENSLLITACPEAELGPLLEAIRPLLRERGGMCLVSDAHWLLH